MTEKEYLEQRVEDQITWYNNKSSNNKKLFQVLKIMEIIFALAVPFLSGFLSAERMEIKYLISLIGVIIAAIAGIVALLRLQENWIEYRTTAETLKHEKFLFVTKVGPYSAENAFEIFVERFENLISKENSNWSQYVKQKK